MYSLFINVVREYPWSLLEYNNKECRYAFCAQENITSGRIEHDITYYN